MRRWCVGIFIATYLTALSGGLVSHTLSVGNTAHPAMYFLVWDMYCGWSAYNVRYHAIAEGVSGAFYKVDQAPWGSFKPYGTQDRYQYSTSTGWMAKAAAHTVAHTRHEPIARIFVVEENWPKQFDLPDYVWKSRYNIPKQPYHYTKIRVEMDGTGAATNYYPTWVEVQAQSMIADNPRLQHSIRNSRPFWMVDEHESGGNRYFNKDEQQQNQLSAVSSLSGPAAN